MRRRKDYNKSVKGQMALRPEYENRCFVCHKKFGRGFSFHHLWYLKKGEVHYKNYKNSKKYNEDLSKLIKRNPKRFLLLCRVHHHYVEVFNNMKNDKFLRFIMAVKLTKT